jgi:hypothetical protein
MSKQEYLYKIGNLYIKSKESEYLNKYYLKSDINLTNEEYYKQIQPFIESDKIKIITNDDYDIYSFRVYNYTIYDMILDYLNINECIPCVCDGEYDTDEYYDNIAEFVEQYYNAKYISKELFNKNINIKNKIENCSIIFSLISMPLTKYTNYDMSNKQCKYSSCGKRCKFWDDIKYIYLNFDVLNIMHVNDNVFDRFKRKMIKYKNFFNFNNIICNEITQISQLDNMTIAAILIDKLNLFDKFTQFYFGENFPNGQPTKEFRIKQISEALEFQHNFKFPYSLEYGEKTSCIDTYRIKPRIDDSVEARPDEYAVSSENNKYMINYNFYCYIYLSNTIGLVSKTYTDCYSESGLLDFFKDDDSKYDIVQFLYLPNYKNDKLCLKYTHKLKFYNINNCKMFIGDCKYTKNKYLSNLVINNSKLFEEYFKIYSNDEIYNLDISIEIKNYNKFNELFKDNESAGNTITYLIENIFNEYIDDDLKDIFYNMYYLQMFDIIEMIELITLRKIPLNIYEFKNTNEIINECFTYEKEHKKNYETVKLIGNHLTIDKFNDGLTIDKFNNGLMINDGLTIDKFNNGLMINEFQL